MKVRLSRLFFLVLAGLLISCQNLLNLLQQSRVKSPTVSVTAAEITGLSFDRVDLLFNLSVNNPNSLAVKLQGLDYDMRVNGNSLVSGNQNQGIDIAANAESPVKLPLTLKFVDLYKSVSSMIQQDSCAYDLGGGLTFDLPVVGATRIPVTKHGQLPLPKIPRVHLAGIKLKSLSLIGAALDLQLTIENPNAFSVLLQNLNYGLTVNGLNWIKGQQPEQLALTGKKDQTVSFPVTLNFLQIGASVYQLLSDGKNLNYKLDGNFTAAIPDLKISPAASSFDQSGQIDLKK